MSLSIGLDDPRNPWFSWSYIEDNAATLGSALLEHLELTVVSVVVAAVISIPLGILSARSRLAATVILSGSGVLYTIPSLAVFALLAPFLGQSLITVEVGLVMYAMLIIVRATLTGLRQVPPDVIDAAGGMGYSRVHLLTRVELPLAVPSIMTGLRIATVSTVAMVTIGAVVGHGGLGGLILTGFRNNLYKPQILTATILCIALALAFEVLLSLVTRLMTPWTRGRTS
ncbi:ABC transporter permease [Stackebrandtia nassauensis]|uniref:Binding-protein-dependent transport systems inner membrane component n=1 Tax=Stackebrandtia nassauensis (strain DSM 44728 / CIP 108903 / NRRL B-16338 / NBRC 102104 / LLR-40K-21) TaxID=446470 RepID=D3QA32_STANL|nr:ABC transporter permease [Stackebrandtia nassauensis]ADD40744.1 binding-protein-dependent transport systems inner membrane component [Stackebrandtia nassauensis DSM 44728]